MHEFSYELFVPSLNKHLRFGEIKINQTKHIVKYIQNSDDEGLDIYLNKLMGDLCDNDDINHIDRFDKLIVLIGLRAYSIGPLLDLTFNNNTPEKFTYTKKLLDFTSKLCSSDLQSNHTIKIDDKLTLYLKYPKNLFYSSDHDILPDSIFKIKIGSNTFNAFDISRNELNDILDKLPNQCIPKIESFLLESNEKFKHIRFMSIKNPVNNKQVTEIPVDITSNSIFEIVKLVFMLNLNEIYDLIYILSSKLGYNGKYIEENMTFVEGLVYVNKYNDEIKEKEEQMKKQMSTGMPQSQGIPAPMSIPFTGIE